jgi:hypothetical protein
MSFSLDDLDLRNTEEFTKSDEADLQEIEDMLMVKRDTLKGVDFFVGRLNCVQCDNRPATGADLVYSALKAGHSPMLILYSVLTTREQLQNPPREISCRHHDVEMGVAPYYGGKYGCRP